MCLRLFLSFVAHKIIFAPMKHHGCILDFTHERNADLMRAYRAKLAEVGHIIMPDIFSRVADSPASRFWVSEERAAVVVSAMLTERPLPRMRQNKREMFEEIFRRYTAAQAADPTRSVFEIVADVVNQPAPKFYLTPRTVGEFIYRIKSGWYDKHNAGR